MAQLTPDVTYDELKRIGDWQLTEEAQRSALAELVNAIAGLDNSLRWGTGKTSASDGQRFYRANRDLGRVFKTEFILQYMAEPELRGRIRRGLLKVEQLHALARDVFYGRRGRINARELWEQMNTCSCLTLILACIVYWQAREISWAIGQSDPAKEGLDLSLLDHVSPIEWDNVVLYGQYILDPKLIRRRRRRRGVVVTLLSV